MKTIIRKKAGFNKYSTHTRSDIPRLVCRFVLTPFFLLSLLALPRTVQAAGKDPNDLNRGYIEAPTEQIAFLKSIDTILFDENSGFGDPNIIRFSHNALQPGLLQTLKEEAAGNEWINVNSIRQSPSSNLVAELNKPNVAHLSIFLHFRVVRGPNAVPIRLGAVTAKLGSDSQGKVFSDPITNGAVPFVISDDTAENLRQIQEAVKILTAHIPGLMRCARKMAPYSCDEDKLRYKGEMP